MLLSIWLAPVVSQAASSPTTTQSTTTQPSAGSTFKPQILTTNKLSLVSKPTISLLSPKGCYKRGDRISIIGKNFGKSSTNKTITITDKRTYFAVAILSWSDQRIDVNLINKRLFSTGVSYAIGIRKSDGSAWLSNLYNGVAFCADKIQVQTTQLASPPDETPVASADATETPQDYSSTEADYVEDGGWQEETVSSPMPARRNSGGGGLLEKGLPPAPQVPSVIQKEQQTVEPGEVLLVSDSMPAAQQIQAQLSAEGFRVKRRKMLKNLGLVLSTYATPDGMLVSEALKIIRQFDSQIWVDANTRYTLNGKAATQANNYSFRLMSWPAKRQKCGKKSRIGLIDTQVNVRQRTLKKAAIEARSFVPNGVKPSSPAHGTTLASLLVGESVKDNYQGLVPGARLYSAGVFRLHDDDTVDTSSELLVKAVDWLVGKKVSVINISLGGQRNLILEAALKQAMRKGIVIVAAAGNNGPDAKPLYPAAQKNVIAVTAVDARKKVYHQANQGKYIDFSAPGVDLWLPDGNGRFSYFSGTSYAAPYIAATVVMAKKKSKSYSALIKILSVNSQDLGIKGQDTVFGRGLVSVRNLCK